MRQTSVEAYQRISQGDMLPRSRMAIYSVLYKSGPLTCNEVFRHVKQSTSVNNPNVHARINELCRQGVVREVGETRCTVTGMRVMRYDVTANLPAPLVKEPTKDEQIIALAKEVAAADDRLGDALGEALVMRRTLEWLRFKCHDLDIARCVASNTLDYLGYTEQTDDCELAEIYDARSGHGTHGVGGKAREA